MCTYATIKTAARGQRQGPESRWFHVTDATVYFDHPVHAMAEHTLNIDFADPARGTRRAGRRRADCGIRPGARRRDRGGARLGARRARRLSRALQTPRRCPESCLAALGQQTDALGLLHRLGAVARTELSVQRTRVLLDRVRREEQLLGDLTVGRACRDQFEHLTLTL